jgi:hypothetical protein
MKLFAFGCSYTEDCSIYYKMGGMSPEHHYVRYMRYKGDPLLGSRLPGAWTGFLGEKIGCEVINRGSGAASNGEIFSKICRECKSFEKNDIVIIEWTYLERFRWVNEKTNQWAKLGVYKDSETHDIINKSTHQDISINRSYERYTEEIYDYEKIIDQLAKTV